MPVLVTCKSDENPIKTEGVSIRQTRFPHNKSMGAFCCHGNHSFEESAPKPKSSLSAIPLMAQIIFDQDWPTDLGDSIISLLKI